MIAIRGVALVHHDRPTKEWFFEQFTARMQPADPNAFARLLDSPKRVVFEVRPVAIAVEPRLAQDARQRARRPGRGGRRPAAGNAP